MRHSALLRIHMGNHAIWGKIPQCLFLCILLPPPFPLSLSQPISSRSVSASSEKTPHYCMPSGEPRHLAFYFRMSISLITCQTLGNFWFSQFFFLVSIYRVFKKHLYEKIENLANRQVFFKDSKNGHQEKKLGKSKNCQVFWHVIKEIDIQK